MSEKEAVIGLKTHNRPIGEIADTLEEAKSTIWYTSKKKECVGELVNIPKRPRRPQKNNKRA